MMAIGDRELPLVWTAPLGPQVAGARAARPATSSAWTARRSIELLVRLREWATQPQFVYRHTWSVGDLVIWDNTGTMHRATPYDPASGRLLQRTKLAGEESFA